MKRLKLLSVVLASTIIFAGCGNKKNKDESSVNPEAEICDFNDFQYLMFTENGKSVLRDEEGNEYTLSTDGYYYDTKGTKILEYGVGDTETYKLGASSGAISKSNRESVSAENDASNAESSDESNSQVEEGDKSNVEQSSGTDGNYEDTTIADWESVKAEIMEAEGIMPTTEAPWHGRSDDLESYKADGGSDTLVSNKSYNTAINLGSSIPGVLSIQKITTGSTYTAAGTLTLDAEAFNEYMRGIYGDTQINDAGEEVPANYATYLNEQYCSFSLIATDGMNYVFSDIQNLYFDENYTVSFNLSLQVPEGYTPYLSIQDIPYNI